jgi:transcriptional regulator with XRE-family HTH domain
MDQIKIGKFIAQLRHEQHLTQEELGEKIGVTNKTISRWENAAYTPDIEMLQLLSKVFKVSVNEMIAGECISEEEAFKEKADENLISAIKSSSFTLQERISFFKKKWLKEHILLIIIYALAFITIFVYGSLIPNALIVGISPILGIACYMWIRNRMMIYVEGNAFSGGSD